MINLYTLASPFIDQPEVLLFSAVMGLTLMVFSRIWEARIYSIAAVGIWLYLAIELQEEPAIIITMIVLMCCELWYAFIAKAS